MGKNNYKRILIILGAVLFLGLFYCWNRKNTDASFEYLNGSETTSNILMETSISEKILVDISGEVMSPGVYELDVNSRIFEAIQMAGGETPDADLTSINQAQVLSDGEKLYIPRIGENVVINDSNTDGVININTATEEDLTTLSGIGPSKAKAIIEYRKEHGKFKNIEELRNIQGIGESIFNKIKDKIRV